MKFLDDLISQAGFATKPLEIKIAIALMSLLIGLVAHGLTKVFGLGLAAFALSTLFLLESLRMLGGNRQRNLQLAWPTVFDSMSQAVSSGISFESQVERLAASAPLAIRPSFITLHHRILSGVENERAILEFSEQQANRFGDLFAKISLLGLIFGQSGQNQTWKYLASRTRTETATLGLLLAKQNWTVGTAKLALLAPWLIAILLMQLGENKEAFQSPSGSAVLLTGLAVSLFAYFWVNQLGKIKLPVRTLNAFD